LWASVGLRYVLHGTGGLKLERIQNNAVWLTTTDRIVWSRHQHWCGIFLSCVFRLGPGEAVLPGGTSPTLSDPDYGLMFWFSRNRLAGSYFRLICTSCL
jgi:hypothetical protein